MKLKKRWCVSLISLFAFLSPAGAVEFNAVQLNQSKLTSPSARWVHTASCEFRVKGTDQL